MSYKCGVRCRRSIPEFLFLLTFTLRYGGGGVPELADPPEYATIHVATGASPRVRLYI